MIMICSQTLSNCQALGPGPSPISNLKLKKDRNYNLSTHMTHHPPNDNFSKHLR